MVLDGVAVEYRDGGRIRGAQARVIDFDDPANNDWLAVNQFTVVENTGSAADPLEWQPHIRNKPRREALANRFRDPDDPLRVVLVRDMWLTGFDAPSLHTMYVDKPMRGHGLMQAIARVNRVFRDKPGGLVVDYLGLAHELKKALATYTESGGRGETALDQAEAVAVMQEKYEICRGLFWGFDWSAWAGGDAQARLGLLPAALEHILAQEDGKDRCKTAVRNLAVEALRRLLQAIACELVETVRNNVTIDWTMRENVRAKLRSYVRRILRRHGYPPDKQEKATQTVLEQAEALSAVWAEAA